MTIMDGDDVDEDIVIMDVDDDGQVTTRSMKKGHNNKKKSPPHQPARKWP